LGPVQAQAQVGSTLLWLTLGLSPTKEHEMTPDKFRSLALELPKASESEHMGHPDFRVNGKIIASLGYPDAAWGMVKLTPEQQRSFLEKAPRVFGPCAGVWGQRGSTKVDLAAARVELVRAALHAAWQTVVEKNKPSAR
jgi:hypothetical protein